MKTPAQVLRELGMLYDFCQELRKFRLPKRRKRNKRVAGRGRPLGSSRGGPV